MQYVHNIFIANSYSFGDRIAYDLVVDEEVMNDVLGNQDKFNKIQTLIADIYNSVGRDISLASHVVFTDSESWESVVKKDSFFKDVVRIKNRDNFIRYVAKSRELTKNDVITFIAAIVPSTELNDDELNDFVESIAKDYHSKYGTCLYSTLDNDDCSLLDRDAIKKCANIICNKVLNSDQGLVKFKFLADVIKKDIGNSLDIV